MIPGSEICRQLRMRITFNTSCKMAVGWVTGTLSMKMELWLLGDLCSSSMLVQIKSSISQQMSGPYKMAKPIG